MKIMVVAAVEDPVNVERQIAAQNVRRDFEYIYIDKEPAAGIVNRRTRIAENQSWLKDMVKHQQDADYIWQLEGDVLLPPDTLERLIASYESIDDPNKAYVSGVQIGRHGLYMVGAWHIGDDSYRSLDYRSTGIQSVDGTGLYCLLANREAWLNGVASWEGEPWGPDVNFGLSLKEKGYNIYVDMSIPVGHKTRRGEIWPHHATTTNVTFFKEGERWNYKTHD